LNYALTVYPLSKGFRGRLEQALTATPVYLNVGELRSLSPLTAVRRLRRLDGARLVLPIEDENSHCILPLLKAVAAVSNAREIEVRHPDLRRERISRTELLTGLAGLASASARARWDASACAREAAALFGADRLNARLGDAGDVLYLNANLWFGVKAGGSIGHIAGVVNALKESGRSVLYASAGGRTMIREDVPMLALQAPAVFGLPYELNYYRFHRMVVSQLRTLPPPRFVYQRMSIANYAGVELARRWNVPLVLEYNGSEVWIAKNWGRPLRYHSIAARVEEVCLRHADVVVTISDVLRDELIEKGVAQERIVSYPNCIDPGVFDPARFSRAESLALRRKLDIPADATMVSFIGTFGQWHGADVLAEAIRRLALHQGDWLERAKLHFVLVGDGLKMPIVRETLGDPRCSRFVTLTGLVPQSDAPAYLAASDVLVSPHVANADGSRFFGSPTKLFEYMAMGKAIVASDLDQIGEVLRNSVRASDLPSRDLDPGDGRLAVLFRPGDIDGLIASLKFAAERPATRLVLGANARNEALAKYTWTHHTAAILDRVTAVAR
jgi:glycosyltransferase involved in cell wall biosynthesis